MPRQQFDIIVMIFFSFPLRSIFPRYAKKITIEHSFQWIPRNSSSRSSILVTLYSSGFGMVRSGTIDCLPDIPNIVYRLCVFNIVITNKRLFNVSFNIIKSSKAFGDYQKLLFFFFLSVSCFLNCPISSLTTSPFLSLPLLNLSKHLPNHFRTCLNPLPNLYQALLG